MGAWGCRPLEILETLSGSSNWSSWASKVLARPALSQGLCMTALTTHTKLLLA